MWTWDVENVVDTGRSAAVGEHAPDGTDVEPESDGKHVSA
jgi:hypothetical protein